MKQIDRDELELKLLRVFAEVFKLVEINDETPIHEARARAEQAGKMFGRAFCACMHEDPTGHDVAFYLRTAEQYGKAAFLDCLRNRRPLKGI